MDFSNRARYGMIYYKKQNILLDDYIDNTLKCLIAKGDKRLKLKLKYKKSFDELDKELTLKIKQEYENDIRSNKDTLELFNKKITERKMSELCYFADRTKKNIKEIENKHNNFLSKIENFEYYIFKDYVDDDYFMHNKKGKYCLYFYGSGHININYYKKNFENTKKELLKEIDKKDINILTNFKNYYNIQSNIPIELIYEIIEYIDDLETIISFSKTCLTIYNYIKFGNKNTRNIIINKLIKENIKNITPYKPNNLGTQNELHNNIFDNYEDKMTNDKKLINELVALQRDKELLEKSKLLLKSMVPANQKNLCYINKISALLIEQEKIDDSYHKMINDTLSTIMKPFSK